MKTKDLFRRLSPNARILLIRLRSMGDCLLLTGPVRALKEEFPDFRISVLAEERFAPCFDGNPDFHEVLTVKSKYAMAARLAGRRFSLTLNLHGGPTSLFYTLAPWGRRIGVEGYQYSWLYHGLAPRIEYSAHSVEASMLAFRWLGMTREECPPLRYADHPAEAERMRAAVKERPYAVIHPGTAWTTKRWDAARFAAVAAGLRRRGLGIVFTCGPGEEGMVSRAAQETPGATILLGLTIPELAELIRGAALFVGCDSGPMHLAAAVGVPVVVPWGSSNSTHWRPWGVESRVVQNPFECNPCAGYECHVAETPLCIESVTTQQVNAAVAEILDSRT
ncbi:MAG TPA: glycosyltransferase family 9 protein [Terriglobia bacterium]|nr:glycosyltransferase family 9 protein [Terriglobia bacterium]